MRINFFATESTWCEEIVSYVTQLVSSFPHPAYVALTGGKTPIPFYTELGQNLDMGNSHIFLADERYVLADHPDSNQRMIRMTLCQKNLPMSFHAFDTTGTIDESLKKYQVELQQIPNQILDLCILGIGSDGHILSLFPHTAALQITEATVIHTTTDTFAVHDRLTMTLPYVTRAKHLVLCARGQDKLSVIETLQTGEGLVDDLPVVAIKDHPNLVVFFQKDAARSG